MCLHTYIYMCIFVYTYLFLYPKKTGKGVDLTFEVPLFMMKLVVT